MGQYQVSSKLRTLCIGLMILGLVCMGITFFTDDAHHSRFWSNFLHNSSFFTGIAFMALFFYCANIIAFSGWYTQFKRIWESYYLFLLPGLILMVIIGIAAKLGMNHLYHWADAASVEADPILKGKSNFLNFTWFFGITIGAGAIWYILGRKLRSLSLEEDIHGTIDYSYHKKMRIYAAIFLPIAGFTSAAAVWLWLMSVDAHWYSTLYAWYCCVSWIVAMIALTICTIIYLKGKGYYEFVTKEHLHDLGKYLFAFSIFWTYLWFSQYMLIWYANVGEETTYFKTRLDDYPVLFFGNLIINFVLPFFILLRNDTKRKYGSLIFVSGLVFLGHWLDFFQMIKPGVLHTMHEVGGHGNDHGAGDHSHGEHVSNFVSGFSMPGLLEIGTMLGFLGFFLFFAFTALSKTRLVPTKDPYVEESAHHHA